MSLLAERPRAETSFDNPPREALYLAAQLELADNGSDAKTAPVRLVARSGEPIVHWYWGKVTHDLAGMRLSKPKIPLDYCHDDAEVIGYANHFDASSGDLVASGALVPYRDQDRAAEVLFKAKSGVPYEASIFFDEPLVIEQVAEGAAVQVNGREFTGPGIVIRQWTLRGIAVCPYGADPHTETSRLRAVRTAHPNPPGADPMAQQLSSQADTAETTDEVATEQTPATESQTAPETSAAEPAAEAVPSEPDAEAALSAAIVARGKAFTETFGERGGKYFAAGMSLAAACRAFAAEIQAENEQLRQELADAKAALKARRGEGSPVSFSPSPDTPNGRRALADRAVSELGAVGRIAHAIEMPGRG